MKNHNCTKAIIKYSESNYQIQGILYTGEDGGGEERERQDERERHIEVDRKQQVPPASYNHKINNILQTGG